VSALGFFQHQSECGRTSASKLRCVEEMYALNDKLLSGTNGLGSSSMYEWDKNSSYSKWDDPVMLTSRCHPYWEMETDIAIPLLNLHNVFIIALAGLLFFLPSMRILLLGVVPCVYFTYTSVITFSFVPDADTNIFSPFFALIGVKAEMKINRISGTFLLLGAFFQVHWLIPLVHAYYSDQNAVEGEENTSFRLLS